jgi:membrane protein implicated in regulation of membrane protease activity
VKPAGDGRERKTGLMAWVAMLDDIVIIGLIFLALWAFGVRLSGWAIALIAVVLGAVVVMLNHYIVPSLRRRVVTGAEAMLGQAALVTDPLVPEGTVHYRGEIWHARSLEGDLPAGTAVEIVAVARLTLEVKRK